KYFQGDVLLASKYKPYFKALNSGRSLLAKNAHKDPRTSAFTEDYLLPNGIGAMMDVPIWQDGRVIGVLCHEHVGRSRRWTQREEEFANAVADCITGSKHAEERRQAEVRYHALLEASDDMVFIEDYHRSVLYINPAVEKHTGYTAKDYDFNVHQHPLIHPEDLPNVNRFIADFIQSETMFSKTLENRFVDRWGRLRWHSSVLSKIEYLQKPAIQFVVSDITGQKFAIDALHRSEERFTMLVRQLRDLITIVAADGTIRYESPSVFPMLGYAQDELLGRNAFDRIHPEDLDVLRKTFEKLLRAPGETATAMYRFLHKNGTWRHCESVGVNLLLDASVEGILITTRDVTERVEAEQLLKEREERYRKLVESFHDILFITDFKRNMLYINPAMERLTGYTLNDFRFPPDDNPFVHPEDFKRVNAFIDEFAQSAKTHSGIIENRFFDRWGKMHWYSSVISKIEYDDQPCLQFICRDISDVRRSEEALTQSDQKYRAFIEQSTEGIYRLELDEPVPIDWPPEEQVANIFARGYIAEANTAQALMYGFNSVDELIGLRLKTLLLPEDPHNVAYMVDFVKSGYRFANQESHEIDKYGVQKIFLNSAIGIVEDGKLIRVWGTQKDITELKKSEIALKQSEERYRAFVTNSSEGICLFEFETPIAVNLPAEDQIASFFETAFISECNSTYALSEGYRAPDQLTGIKVWRNEGAEQAAQRDWVAYLIRNGYSASDIESEKISKDGSKRFFLNSYTGVVEQGFWKRVWAVRKDVTERRLVEEDLRNNEANLAAILENSHDSIWSIDAAYRIVTINSTFRDAYYAAFGIRLEVGMNVMDSIPDDLGALWKARYERVIVRGEVFMESDHYDLGGESRDYEISFFPIRTDDGIIRGASIFSRDVTERVRNREAVERREKYYRALIENALDLISIISADGTILYESPSVEKITGFTPNELIGKNVLDFAHPEDRPAIREAFQTGIHQGQKIVNVHFRFLHKDHSWRTLEVTAHNLLHDAVVGGIVVNSRDITERKKSEEVLRQSEEKFRLLAENLPGVVYMCENDADFTFIYTSEAILDITGYPKEDFYDRRISLSMMYHPDDVDMINHIVHTAVRDQHSFSLTYRIRHRNGSWRWLSEVGSGVYADGKLL
ncbi:MAG TPA: PAS domain S-box protein, partial [bacterium]|nr:PAS domain S-box protein [bacterium]